MMSNPRLNRTGTGIAAALMLAGLLAIPASAQSPGGTGGSVGKQDKSLGGGSDAPAARPSRARPAPEPTPRARGGGSGGVAGYDGAWALVSVGQTCGGIFNSILVITSGRIVSQGLTGQVGGNGSVRTVSQSNGITSTGSGRLSGRSGSGSYSQSNGCVGRWTAVKQ